MGGWGGRNGGRRAVGGGRLTVGDWRLPFGQGPKTARLVVDRVGDGGDDDGQWRGWRRATTRRGR